MTGMRVVLPKASKINVCTFLACSYEPSSICTFLVHGQALLNQGRMEERELREKELPYKKKTKQK